MTAEPRGSVETPHFVVHCAPGTFAMQQLPQITARLEKAYGIVVSLLGSPSEMALPIQVWLDEPDRESTGPPPQQAREVIRAPYLPESPGEGLDRAVRRSSPTIPMPSR